MPRLTGRTLADPHAMSEALDEIAERGVAFEDQEAIVGEAEVAAAIVDHRGHPVGAIGVAGPADRLLGEQRTEAIALAVRDVARGLSRDMGARRLHA
jgi:DNA-binding IclR family transcriptional regulator